MYNLKIFITLNTYYYNYEGKWVECLLIVYKFITSGILKSSISLLYNYVLLL